MVSDSSTTAGAPNCRAALQDAESELDLDLLITSPGPANIVLQDAGDGISSVRDIDVDSTPTDLLSVASRAGINTDRLRLSEAALLDWARQAWLYIRARDTITCDVLREFIDSVPDGTRPCLVYGRYAYDWAAGTFLTSVARLPFQEIWLPPGQAPDIAQEIKTYLATAGRYHIDSLFTFISFAVRLAALSPSGGLDQNVANKWLGVAGKMEGALHLSKMDVLPVIDAGRGFVAPLVTSPSLQSLMQASGIRFTADLAKLSELVGFLGSRPNE
jgi:hypothetical protein